MASNTTKHETKKKFKNLPRTNLVKYSSKFLAHVKKYLGHTGTPTKVKTNWIKLYGFGVDEKHFVPRKVLQLEHSFAGF